MYYLIYKILKFFWCAGEIELHNAILMTIKRMRPICLFLCSGLIILIATAIIKIQNLFASFFSWFERGIFTMWHFRWFGQFPSLHLLYRGPRKDHFWISQQIDKRTWAIHFGQFCALRASLGNFGKYYDYNGCYHGWKGEPFDAGADFNFPPKN